MDLNTVKYLADLSKLEYSDEKLEKTANEMTSIMELMDTIKDIDITYDAYLDNHNVFLDGLRTDEVIPSMPTEKVVANAVNS